MKMPDGTVHNHASGSTFHTDWFGAWDDGILQAWTDNCVGKFLNCSAFDLGNGKQGKVPSQFKGFGTPVPRLVDVPTEGPITPPPPPPPQPPPPPSPPVEPPPPPVTCAPCAGNVAQIEALLAQLKAEMAKPR